MKLGKILSRCTVFLYSALLLSIISSVVLDVHAQDSTRYSSTPRTDAITLTWDREPALAYEVFINGKVKQPVSGKSDSIMIDVPHGTHCFKILRRGILISRYSGSVCLDTSDGMELFVPFDDDYI